MTISKTNLLLVPKIDKYRQILNHLKLKHSKLVEWDINAVRRMDKKVNRLLIWCLELGKVTYPVISLHIPTSSTKYLKCPLEKVFIARIWNTEKKIKNSTQLLRSDKNRFLLVKEIIARLPQLCNIVADIFGGNFQQQSPFNSPRYSHLRGRGLRCQLYYSYRQTLSQRVCHCCVTFI